MREEMFNEIMIRLDNLGEIKGGMKMISQLFCEHEFHTFKETPDKKEMICSKCDRVVYIFKESEMMPIDGKEKVKLKDLDFNDLFTFGDGNLFIKLCANDFPSYTDYYDVAIYDMYRGEIGKIYGNIPVYEITAEEALQYLDGGLQENGIILTEKEKDRRAKR